MGEEFTDDKRSGSEPGSIARDGHDELSLEYWLERMSWELKACTLSSRIC